MFYKILTFVLILFITILAIYSIHTNQLPNTENYQNYFNTINYNSEEYPHNYNLFDDLVKPVQYNGIMRPIIETFKTTTMQDNIENNWRVANQHLDQAKNYNVNARNISKAQIEYMENDKIKIDNAFNNIKFGQLDQKNRTGDRNIKNLNQDMDALENEMLMN